ncbi:hypothetical protein CR513_59630, partial [Mucuna pruriens]
MNSSGSDFTFVIPSLQSACCVAMAYSMVDNVELGQLEPLALVYLIHVETTKDELIKLASLPRTQVLLFLCAKAEVKPNPESIDCRVSRVIESKLYQMENNDRTLKELVTPDMVYQPWCIKYPQLEPAQTYELKSGLIHLLPKFHGLAGEDPHKHLKEFHVVCSTMRLQGVPEDYIKKKAFPFSLDKAAKDWLYIQLVLFNTWGDMKLIFLEKFFPTSRTATIRKEICGIRQHSGETLHEYWERFNKLCATCLHHQTSEQLLIQYSYESLTMMDRSMNDAASGGGLMDKTPTAARHLISDMASNTQQFGIKGASQPRMVNEIGAVDNLRLENQMIELTSLVSSLLLENTNQI